MKIVYITYPWFLDLAVEYIKGLSEEVELHVILITQSNRFKSTIFDLKNNFQPIEGKLYSLDDLGDNLSNYLSYNDYIKKCKSFKIMFTPSKWYGLNSINFNLKLHKYIKKIQPSLVHFDDLTIEIFLQSFLLRKFKHIINVHDPVAHSGETNYRRNIVRKLFYSKSATFITFSKHSSKIFFENYGYKSHLLSLVPYTFYRNFSQVNHHYKNYILFFGRVSKYKGVEDLLLAYKELRKLGYKENLIIAGKCAYDYKIPSHLTDIEGVIYLNYFIENNELVSLIQDSEFIVCPYKDATQSGVVMTSFALNKKVIVSKVGGLFEPITEHNGVIYENNNIENLVEAIRLLLENKKQNFNVNDEYQLSENINKLKEIYKKHV